MKVLEKIWIAPHHVHSTSKQEVSDLAVFCFGFWILFWVWDFCFGSNLEKGPEAVLQNGIRKTKLQIENNKDIRKCKPQLLFSWYFLIG